MTDPARARVDAELNTRARAPHYDAVNAAYAALSAAARARLLVQDDLAYGDHLLERLDLLRAPARPQGLMLWFHGGLWRARDRADFYFLADGFARVGLATAMAGYPKCPEVPLARIVAAAGRGCGLSDAPLLVGGHSAGAHLAAMPGSARRALPHCRTSRPLQDHHRHRGAAGNRLGRDRPLGRGHERHPLPGLRHRCTGMTPGLGGRSALAGTTASIRRCSRLAKTRVIA